MTDAGAVETLRASCVRVEARLEQLASLLIGRDALPTDGELKCLASVSADLWVTLADLLDGLDRGLGSEGSGEKTATLSVAEAQTALSIGVVGTSSPAWQRGLAQGYSWVSERSGAIHLSRRAGAVDEGPVGLALLLPPPQSSAEAAWRAFVEGWTRVAYLGGTHAAGGLASRLMGHPLFTERRTADRCTPPYYRWDRADIEALRARAALLLDEV